MRWRSFPRAKSSRPARLSIRRLPSRFHADIPVYYGSVLPVRRLNGLWSNAQTLKILKERHRTKPYDLVIIFNLKGPQLACAQHALSRLRLPLVLEYEDDKFVDVQGGAVDGWNEKREVRTSARLLRAVSGCMAVSPHLLSQVPGDVPTLLLRGVVGADVIDAARKAANTKEKVVLFSGTHIASNGVAELIKAWRMVERPDWTLHITGHGGLTESLRQMAEGVPGIVFDGLVSREDLVRLMTSASICMNPHQVSQKPGNVFAFKIIEYLAAGAHVLTTPMGALERDLERGITYLPDNSPATIAAAIQRVIDRREYTKTAMDAAHRTYGPAAVSESLDRLLAQVRTAK